MELPVDASRRAWTTLAAAALIVVVTLPFLALGARDLAYALGVVDPPFRSEQAVYLGVLAGQEGVVSWLVALVVVPLSAVALVLAVGVARRRPASREAALLLFGFLGFVLTVLSAVGLAADPPARHAAWGLLGGLADLAVVGLLLAPPTAADFETAEHERFLAAMPR